MSDGKKKWDEELDRRADEQAEKDFQDAVKRWQRHPPDRQLRLAATALVTLRAADVGGMRLTAHERTRLQSVEDTLVELLS